MRYSKLFLASALVVMAAGGISLAQAQVYGPDKMETMNSVYPIGPYDAPAYGNKTGVNVVKVANSYLGGIALDAGGNVFTWGWNGQGQLGIGKTDSYLPGKGTPKELISALAWTAQTYGGGYTPVDFFSNPGNYAANYAAMGIAPELTQPTTIVDVGAGYHHMLALDNQGRVWAWGYNLDGQVGKSSASGPLNKYNFPQRVQGLPANIVKVWGNNGYLDRGQSFALTSDGQLWSWGSNLNGKQGVGTLTITPDYQATPRQAIFPAGTVIVDVQGGDYHNIALDDQGNVWVWGYGGAGLMGDGAYNTYTTPHLLPRPAGMGKAVKISNSYDNSLVLDENHVVWQWGYLYVGPGAGNLTIARTPRQVDFEPAEVARVGYVPVAQDVAAGESVSYFIDQYGRSWAWGDNRYFGFGREGGYEDSNNIITTKAYQYPQIIGDGDTQIYDKDPKTPADGRVRNATYGTYGFNELHPTIYDDKYNVTASVEEWKNLAFKPIPKIRQMIGSRSSYIILDYDGNIFKWANDGSGTIAWGNGDYFDKKYDFTGNGRDGTYDAYCYEVMIMRNGGGQPPCLGNRCP